MCAASNGHYEVTKLLIEKGANLEAKSMVRKHHEIMSTDPSVLYGPPFICPLSLYIWDIIILLFYSAIRNYVTIDLSVFVILM